MAIIFTGNTAPFHITQPPTDNYVQIASPNAAMVNLTCSLNISISRMIITWTNNKNSINSTEIGNTTTVVIKNPQPGVYQCVFNDVGFDGSGWTLRRNIVFSITGMYVCMWISLCDYMMKCI